MHDPFYRGPVQPEKDRNLREAPLPQAPTQEVPDGTITEEDLRLLFDGFANQYNRATALQIAVEKEAIKLTVPVDPDAVQVGNAVRRRDQASDGSFITFDLFKDMIEFQIDSARKVSFEIVGELSGDLITDANKINRYIKSGGGGLSAWEEFLLVADQWLILFMLDRLTTQFQCVQHKETCAAKEPPGTEDPPIAVRQALSAAAMMLLMGMRKDHVLLASQRANALNIPPVDLINRAQRLELDDVDRALVEAVGASDHILIVDYVQNYIARHPEGYDMWIAYTDLRRLREDASITYIHAREYSKDHATLLDYSYKSVHKEPAIGFFGQLAGVRTQTTMSGAHFETLRSKLGGIDLAISSIGQTLTSGIALDVICCIARFFGKQDIKFLKKIRHLLQVARAAMTGALAQGMLDANGILDWIVQAILQQLVTFVEKIFDKAALDVNKWFNGKSDDAWMALYECPLIEDLISYIVQAIARLRTVMFNMVNKYLGNISIRYDNMSLRWGTMYDMRRLNTIINIIDRVISEIEFCARDDGNNTQDPVPLPGPGEDPSIGALAPKKLIIDPVLEARLFANSSPISRGEGLRPIPPMNHTLSTAEEAVTVSNFMSICHGIPVEDAAPVDEEDA